MTCIGTRCRKTLHEHDIRIKAIVCYGDLLFPPTLRDDSMMDLRILQPMTTGWRDSLAVVTGSVSSAFELTRAFRRAPKPVRLRIIDLTEEALADAIRLAVKRRIAFNRRRARKERP